EVGVRAPEPLGRRPRHRLDLALERPVEDERDAGRARQHLDGAIVVGRAEAAGDEACLRGERLRKGRLELPRIVADDRDPRRLEAVAERLAREERAVQVAALAADELAPRDDDRGARAGHPATRTVRSGVTTTARFGRAGNATGLPSSRTRSPPGRRTRR